MSSKRVNNPEFLREFINYYQNYPCLWKIRDKTYSNRDIREKAYTELVNFYKTADPSATQETVRCKINNLRSAFRKELNKVKNSKKSGCSAEDIYAPTLWYYDLLAFTADQEENRNTVSTLSESDDDEQIVENDEVSKFFYTQFHNHLNVRNFKVILKLGVIK